MLPNFMLIEDDSFLLTIALLLFTSFSRRTAQYLSCASDIR